MKLFLDTSSLFKLYYQEADSNNIESFFIHYKVTNVFLSELSKIEFESTVWKKVRQKDITDLQANVVLEAFEADYAKYTFIQVDNLLIKQAKIFIANYGKQGLRTLDSIQLSTAVMFKSQADLFLSSDNLLNSFFKLEALPTESQSNKH